MTSDGDPHPNNAESESLPCKIQEINSALDLWTLRHGRAWLNQLNKKSMDLVRRHRWIGLGSSHLQLN